MVNLWVCANTDGILVKLFKAEDKAKIIAICDQWSARTKMELEFDEYTRVIQSNVNNYIIVDKDGNMKRKGAVVKKLSRLDYDLPIVNEAVVNFLVHGTPVVKTINGCNELIKFQKVTKISRKYSGGVHNGMELNERVHRCFASTLDSDGSLFKVHKQTGALQKTPSTPEHCFIINENVLDMPIPRKLDKQWYISEAKNRISNFTGGKLTDEFV